LGKCFRCEKKYALGYQCSMMKIHIIKGVEGNMKEFLDVKGGNSNGLLLKKTMLKKTKLRLV